MLQKIERLLRGREIDAICPSGAERNEHDEVIEFGGRDHEDLIDPAIIKIRLRGPELIGQDVIRFKFCDVQHEF